MLLVALYRHIGIPARVSCGFWEGGAGHAWTELYFPGAGWFVADGSAGNSQSEDGSFAYNFGTNWDLNKRAAVMRGNTFNIGDLSAAWMQGPAVMTSTPALPDGATSGTSSLGELSFTF